MTIYIDITQLEKGRANTGIQRVVKEFLKRASVSKDIVYKILILKEEISKAELLDNNEVGHFLKDVANYQFKNKVEFDLLSIKPTTPTAFFDIDSNWNVVFQRSELYPKLKHNGFLIFNFIYDLIPILLPQFTHDATAHNFRLFIDAVYQYSDLVMFDSLSAQNDFIDIKNNNNITRDISTRVIGLGSDFLKVNTIEQDEKIKNILEKKYILFVGTIEPRKSQAEVLEAFEVLAEKYPDLNLVIIGKKGWKVDSLIQKISSHKLKDKQLFWLSGIDDNTLNRFYQNAFLVTYLSKYEGYGLPIAESLACGNVTITSKNSSMYEVGKDVADYILYNSLNELVSLISLYCDNENIYNAKKQYIKEVFKTTSWEQFYISIANIFSNFEKSLSLKQNHLNYLQFVFISIDKESLEGTIKSFDKYADFVKEYIVVTQAKLIDEFQKIKSSHNIIIIDENEILGKYSNGFSSKDHQSKNWLLRASLLNLNILEDEFIMLDDDNRALKDISIDKFIKADGSYNAYYFYTLQDWHHELTEYDKGQQNMKYVLNKENYELYSYSSHAPQIINKKIFQEVIDKFFDLGLKLPLDEWSTYFNYAVSLYPYAFNKKVYETLNWPGNPSDWEQKYIPSEITFENYYKDIYVSGFFDYADTLEQKINKKTEQITPYLNSKNIFNDIKSLLSINNRVHPTIKFKIDKIEFYLSNIPHFIIMEENSVLRLKLNYKLLNPKLNPLNVSVIINIEVEDKVVKNYTVDVNGIDNSKYQESIIELPVLSKSLKEDQYKVTFNLKVNNEIIYKDKTPYSMKLVVIEDKTVDEVLNDLEIKKPLLIGKDEIEQVEEIVPETIVLKPTFKDIIKSIPFLGWFIRWVYNHLRLNNIKYKVYIQQEQIDSLNHKTATIKSNVHNQVMKNNIQDSQITNLESRIRQQETKIKNQEIQFKKQEQLLDSYLKSQKEQQLHIDTLLRYNDQIESLISKEISFQSESFQQRIDQFIHDAKIDISNAKI